MKAALIKGSNNAVIDFYYDIIVEALSRCGVETEVVSKNEASRDDYEIVIVGETSHSVGIRKKRMIIHWAQGVAPEESFMRNHSKLRVWVLNFLEKRALKRSDLLFLVSEAQRRHYENKYKIKDLREKSLVMPCFNEVINSNAFSTPSKYNNNVFCYVGSLAVWQCFRETVVYYKQIEAALKDSEFRVYTPNVNEALGIIQEVGVKRYCVEFVGQSELKLKLASCKFGFILRQDDVVNNVATPTKLSNYLSNGVIPVFSDCVDSFKELAKHYDYMIPVSNQFEIDGVLDYSKRAIDSTAVLQEYTRLFDDHYNRNRYIEEIEQRIGQLL